jgi:hypothetical protein
VEEVLEIGSANRDLPLLEKRHWPALQIEKHLHKYKASL